jgi:hypothetical protein
MPSMTDQKPILEYRRERPRPLPQVTKEQLLLERIGWVIFAAMVALYLMFMLLPAT